MTSLKTFYGLIGKKGSGTTPRNIRLQKPNITDSGNSSAAEIQRFTSKDMQEARIMNKFAVEELGSGRKELFKKASAEDLAILCDNNPESCFLRVHWVNPKDGREYYLLKKGISDDGKQIIKILDKDGGFVKEAAVNKKKIIVFECFSDKKDKDFNNFTHSDLMSLFVKRYNPFAEVKVHSWKDELKIDESMLKELDSDTAAISCAFSKGKIVEEKSRFKQWYYKFFNKKIRINPKELSVELHDSISKEGVNFDKIPPHIRIFMAAGNIGKNGYNKYLTLKNVEGVGALNATKNVADYSSSRNSFFTQHYENGEFLVIEMPDRFKISGINEIEIPHESDKFRILKTLNGTSIATSIRSAKVVLNQMMEGIL